MKKVFESASKSIKDVSEDIIKTMMLASEENNKRLSKLNDKLEK